MATVKASVTIQIKAGEANPSPPIGTALGPHGVNMPQFCQDFNKRTQDTEKGMPVTTVITIYSDRTVSFIIKTPPTAILLMKEAGIQKGSTKPSKEVAATLTRRQIESVAKIKMPDLTAGSLEAALRTIAGTARAIGIEVEEL